MAIQTEESGEEMIAAINVTPLVDITLVLLIIFMVTATYVVREAIEVDLPRAAAGGETVGPTLALALDRDGKLFLDGAPATAEDARERGAGGAREEPRGARAHQRRPGGVARARRRGDRPREARGAHPLRHRRGARGGRGRLARGEPCQERTRGPAPERGWCRWSRCRVALHGAAWASIARGCARRRRTSGSRSRSSSTRGRGRRRPPRRPPRSGRGPPGREVALARALPPPPLASAPPAPPPAPGAPKPLPRVGISLGSTVASGAFAVGVGNTLYGKASEEAADPQVRAPPRARRPRRAALGAAEADRRPADRVPARRAEGRRRGAGRARAPPRRARRRHGGAGRRGAVARARRGGRGGRPAVPLHPRRSGTGSRSRPRYASPTPSTSSDGAEMKPAKILLLLLAAAAAPAARAEEAAQGVLTRAPAVVEPATPEYPAEAKAQGISGEVVLELDVSAEGAVIDARRREPRRARLRRGGARGRPAAALLARGDRREAVRRHPRVPLPLRRAAPAAARPRPVAVLRGVVVERGTRNAARGRLGLGGGPGRPSPTARDGSSSPACRRGA